MKPFDPELLRRVPDARTPVAVLSVTGVLSGAVAVALAVCLAWLASTVVTGGALTAPLAWTVALLVTRGLIAGSQESLAGWAGQRVASGIRSQLLRRWSRLPEEARPQPDEAVTRATDGVAAIEPYVARYLPALVAAAVVPALSLVTLLVVDFWSALIVLLTLPLLPLFAALIGKHTEAETRRRWSAMTDLAGHFLDVVRGLPTLVAYGRAERQVDVVAEVGRRHRVATVRTLRTAFLSTVALELLATISVALVAVAVGLRLAYGVMDLQAAMTAILLAPEAYWPVRRVGSEFHNAADGAEALEQLRDDLADDGAPTTPRPGAPDGEVRVVDVRYHHPGRPDILHDLTLTTSVAPGLTALTGPSGAGKTTMLELLGGLRLPTSGRIEAPHAHLATQVPLLLPGTVRENLALASPAATDGEMRLALDRVGLWQALILREGLDTVLGDDGFGLSAGQRGRLGLARAVLSEAPLVLLDEPTAHIAPDTIAALRTVVLELARHRRVLVATHDQVLAALADEQWQLTSPPPQTGDGDAPDAGATTTAPPVERARVGEGAPGAQDGAPQQRRRRSPRGRLALAAALGGLATASGIALTATSGWLIVEASYQPVVLTLLVAIVGVRAFGLARPVLRYAERVTSHDVALEGLAASRTDTYRRLIPLTPARLGRRSRGDVLTAVVRDLDDISDEQVRAIVPAWDAAIASLVAALVVGAFLPRAGLVVVAAAVLAFLLALLDQRLEQSAHDHVVSARGTVHRVTSLVTAQLTQVQAVAGLGRADRLVDRVDASQARADRAARRLSRARGLTIGATWLVVAAAVGSVAWLAGAAYTAGTVSGPVAALVTLTPMALAEAWTGLPDAFGARARAHAARHRLSAMFEQSPAVAQEAERHGIPATEPDPAQQHVPTLRTDDVEATWDPAATLPDLAATSLLVAPGERVVLTGPNGIGKSTLLAVLARHLDPSTGTYHHDAHEIRDLPLAQVRGRMAIADDEPHAFRNTVRANLLLTRPEATDAQLLSALDTADLGDWLGRLTQGLDTRLTGLSGGERTRLNLARAVLSGRPVLLLDEPTAHLDEVTARRVLERLGGTRQSVVMVSHDLIPDGWAEVSLRTEGSVPVRGDRSYSASTQERSVRSVAGSASGMGSVT
ncbi:Transport ATP-binding protein CydD [Serinicoccus hydrothermalis]|uniref:Transport ATP-binding protein CydD n=1 Tax=Serinicoccus hydrothermalis TaxID=1758689 RepID=A0A1B1ND84_9MICO|nr:thiol reductant ABC exporter subunit CydD [Serinicoccus hydrothermalis]ANS79351.1 Transport ATP-binding protein CydD [Serinicoccus hydrothermalis]